jgi:hypothetical protein
MIWPFKKAQDSGRAKGPLPILHFKSAEAFLEYQCEFGHTEIECGVAVAAIVVDARKQLGTPTAVSIGKDGVQLCALKVASNDGGFLALAYTPSEKGDKLQPNDLVLWVPSEYLKEMGNRMSDQRSGWAGLIRAKIKPELDPQNPNFVIACHYN